MKSTSQILSRYVPDWWGETDRDYIETELLNDEHIHRGKLPNRDDTGYVKDGTFTHAGIAIRDALADVKWHEIPLPEALQPPTSEYDSDERDAVRWYTRPRGSIAHTDLLDDGRTIEQALNDELDRLRGPPDGWTYDEVLNTLAGLDIAPSIRHGTSHAYQPSEKTLREKAKLEGRDAATKWKLKQDDVLPHTPLADEVKYVIKTNHRQYVGGQADRIAHLHDYDSPANIEIKVTQAIHPFHILQAETARRAAEELLDEECMGAILRITPDGDHEVLTSEDEGWPEDKCWEMVCARIEELYTEDTTDGYGWETTTDSQLKLSLDVAEDRV